jgi:hypothetical protein
MSVSATDRYGSLHQSWQWWLVLFLMSIPTWSMYDRLFSVLLSPASLPNWMVAILVLTQVVLMGLSIPWFLRRLLVMPVIFRGGLVVMLIGILVSGFFILFPLADSGELGFVSDRDEALDIAVRQLWQGQNPYNCRAVGGVHRGCPQEGNIIAPLPGGIMLTMPFVALGGSAGASLAVLMIALLVLWRTYRSVSLLWAFLMLLLAGMPTILAEIFTGGDHLANALCVTLAAWWCLRTKEWREALLAGALLGLTLSWRAPFLLMVIPVLVAFAKKGRPRNWWIAGVAAVVTFTVVSLPFYWWDPVTFGPLQTQGKLDGFAQLLPNATVWALISAIIVGVWTGRQAKDDAGLLIATGWTVAIPFLWAVVLESIDRGYPTASFFGWYLLMPASVIAFGYVLRLFDQEEPLVNMPSGKNPVNE